MNGRPLDMFCKPILIFEKLTLEINYDINIRSVMFVNSLLRI